MFRPCRHSSRQITETMLSALKKAFYIYIYIYFIFFDRLECLGFLDPIDGGAALLCGELDICSEIVIRCSSI